jgi:hypothetical protein
MESIDQTVNDEVLVAEAYERVKGDLAALKPEEFLQLNVDIPTAVSTVLGVLPEVKALRDRIVKELPAFDVARFDKLEDYALALKDAQAGVLTSTEPVDDLQPLAEEAARVRETLLADAQALAKHGLVDSEQLSQLKGAKGYKNIAQDLDVLSMLLQANWQKIAGKSATVQEDLALASRISTRLLRIVGLREQGPAALADAADRRLRAFTQLINTYEDARRAVQFLRAAEGDADSIAPSLYPGRPRRKQADPVPAPTPAPVTPVSAPSAPVSPSASSTGTAPVASSKGVNVTPASKDPFLAQQ